ncbi:heterokaryon incompatibility protein-domain-containing protein [Podospora fimiseda]|uniref:Heterokaryon incompatibility protein-domain-containing protein n=1 Tax=Podospora fimiseda TaxID=252190 RepID=A0AAN7GXB4_9PEZI|nr:heterokaryon incompatibility protein-domain-containing protein [Podospora fimiseda]
MWLLDTKTLKLCPVSDPEKEKYAILSHTWDDTGEVTFQDMLNIEAASARPGFRKVKTTCNIAKSRGLKYAWIDTCCIDKTSSAELSEAINSMFRWYKHSQVCWVYLSDFEPVPDKLRARDRKRVVAERLRKCRWFTRGWTLQELIAPIKIEFFDLEWRFVGARDDLEGVLSSITNIDESILRDSSGLNLIPAGRKMAWAAGRQTTRQEDRAYSLLGIFGIEMPLLYGEGPKAFYRLQKQIASENNDLSLFAWQRKSVKGTENSAARDELSGIFANSPDDFRLCSTLKKHVDRFPSSQEFTITNKGLRMQNHLYCLDEFNRTEFLLSLDCVEYSSRTEYVIQWLAIRLKKVGNTYLRHKPDMVETSRSRKEWTTTRHRQTSDPQAEVIYIQTVLGEQDAQGIGALMQSGIVVIYGPNLVHHIRGRYGLPALSCANNMDRGGFVFDANGKDNFLAVNVVKFPDSDTEDDTEVKPNIVLKETTAVVCNLQWTGSEHQLRMGIFTGRPILEEIKDQLLLRYSNMSGFLVQDRMPTWRDINLGEEYGKLTVQYLQHGKDAQGVGLSAALAARHGLSRDGPFWIDGYYHVLLEFIPDAAEAAKTSISIPIPEITVTDEFSDKPLAPVYQEETPTH